MGKRNRKVSVRWIPVVLIAGILLGSLSTYLAGRSQGNTAMESSGAPIVMQESSADGNVGLPTERTEVTEGENRLTGNTGEEAVRAWDAEHIYVGGDMVLYGGKYYKAKWWTQNETPGQADVWEDTLEAPPPSAAGDSKTAVDSKIAGGAAAGGAAAASVAGTELPDPGFTGEQNVDFRVVGYYPSWAGNSTYQGTSISDKVQFDKLTHLVYAFAIPTPEGSLRPLENENMAMELIRTAHEYGVKVMLAVGGWSYQDIPLESTFMAATDSRAGREVFASAILDMCENYGFDGVDLDWEHPRVDGTSVEQYEDLVLILEGLLHDKGLLFSCAVLSGATADGNVYYDAAAHTDKVLEAVDWINVMAYDGGDGERHSGYEFAVNSGRYWRDTRGMPAEKINLGVPFYSRPGWAAYGDILENDSEAYKNDVSQYNGMEVWYNSQDTIQKKTAWAGENLGGIMIWEITQDTADRERSLLTAIWEEKQKLERTKER